MHRIIAFVGPSGAGKTYIIDRLANRLPGRFGVLPGFTTRGLRKGEENYNLTTISLEEGKSRYEVFRGGETSRDVNVAPYAGNYYGNERSAVDEFLRERTALKDLMCQGVRNFRKAGYQVDVILVEPIGNAPRPGREEADRLEAEQYASLGAVFSVTTNHRDPYSKPLSVDYVLRRII